jgi:hypothetical protein
VRGIGATSISRRKPNSRSQTIEMPAKIAVNSVEVATMPGNRNVLKSTPPVAERVSPDSPLPSTNSSSSGCARPEISRPFDRTNRIISRCQTTLTARNACAGPEAASCTGTGAGPAGRRSPTDVTGCVLINASPLGAWAESAARRPPRRGSCCRCAT